MIVLMLLCVAYAQELVRLETDQAEQFLSAINEIGIEINGENTTLNVDLALLENTLISGFKDVDLEFKNIRETMYTVNNLNMETIQTSTDMLIEQFVNSFAAQLAATDKYGEIIEKVDATVSSISGVLELIQTASEALNVYSTSTQSVILSSILTATEETNTLLAAFIKTLPVKVLETISTTSFNVAGDSFESGGFDAVLCEYDPFGIGPINCDALVLEGIEMPGVFITPI